LGLKAIRLRYVVAAGVALLATLALALVTQTASAAGERCVPACAIVIQVDGLEPKDVTPETTPVLWALSHSTAPPAPPAASVPGIAGRAGFNWQAARGTVTTGTAPATAALLTGSHPSRTGIPSDAFLKSGSADSEVRLGGESPITSEELASESLLAQVASGGESKVAAFVGDPALYPLATAGVETTIQPVDGVFWTPGAGEGVPAYCTPPRDLNPPTEPPEGSPSQGSVPACPAPDMQTLDEALTGLTTNDLADEVSLAFVHLAELGAIKRLHGDTDGLGADDAEAAVPAVADALRATDAAIGSFIGRYAQDSNNGQIKWPRTTLFVVGSHGYELTPLSNRVADPADPARDLTDFVRQEGGEKATLVPQGTVGTIWYASDNPEEKSSKLKAIRDALLDPAAGPNSSAACEATGGCIEDVLYVRDDPLAGDNTVARRYQSWRLAHPTRPVAGDLLVITKPGWALGRSAPTPTTETELPVALTEVDNPFEGSAGGPRNRAIFALVNGPSSNVVRPLPVSADGGGRYPVTSAAYDASACPANPANAVSDDVNAVNLDPADDADDPGHECQAETVDFAPTIAALLRVSLEDFDGRFLQEAFVETLGFPQEEVLPDPDPVPEPAAPAVEIYIPPPPPPPPPPKGFDFEGLVRDLRAQVVDKDGCAWTQARRGATLDHLKIEGDFGKPLTAVTLTFYRSAKAARRARGSGQVQFVARAAAMRCGHSAAASAKQRPAAPRRRLKAIAKFKPFTVQRGHVSLKLKVPPQFRPQFVGIAVQEARTVGSRPASGTAAATPNFLRLGPKAGGILRIADARRLHTRKQRARR